MWTSDYDFPPKDTARCGWEADSKDGYLDEDHGYRGYKRPEWSLTRLGKARCRSYCADKQYGAAYKQEDAQDNASPTRGATRYARWSLIQPFILPY